MPNPPTPEALIAALDAVEAASLPDAYSEHPDLVWRDDAKAAVLAALRATPPSAPAVPGEMPACPTDVCEAAADGVTCADDECDIASGVRRRAAQEGA